MSDDRDFVDVLPADHIVLREKSMTLFLKFLSEKFLWTLHNSYLFTLKVYSST